MKLITMLRRAARRYRSADEIVEGCADMARALRDHAEEQYHLANEVNDHMRELDKYRAEVTADANKAAKYADKIERFLED